MAPACLGNLKPLPYKYVYMYICTSLSLSLPLHCLQINDLAWFARLGLGLVDVVQGILIIYSFKKLAEA